LSPCGAICVLEDTALDLLVDVVARAWISNVADDWHGWPKLLQKWLGVSDGGIEGRSENGQRGVSAGWCTCATLLAACVEWFGSAALSGSSTVVTGIGVDANAKLDKPSIDSESTARLSCEAISSLSQGLTVPCLTVSEPLGWDLLGLEICYCRSAVLEEWTEGGGVRSGCQWHLGEGCNRRSDVVGERNDLSKNVV
jgi:hypothetical protein